MSEAKKYRMVDDGYTTFKKIMYEREWIGRIQQFRSGGYFGIIERHYVTADDELECFVAVVAKHLGYADVSAMSQAMHGGKLPKRTRRPKPQLDLPLAPEQPLEEWTAVYRPSHRRAA